MRNFPLGIRAAIAAWAVVVAAGMFLIWDYEMASGESGAVPARWPVESTLQLALDRPHLLLFAHPRCPCTRASLEELARLMSDAGDRVVADVVFLKPSGVDESWVRDALWRRASDIPGVRVVDDLEGREAVRFGVRTSGHVLLYETAGNLVFSGGITASRGHEGDNSGAAAIAAWIEYGRKGLNETPVFGCSLATP